MFAGERGSVAMGRLFVEHKLRWNVVRLAIPIIAIHGCSPSLPIISGAWRMPRGKAISNLSSGRLMLDFVRNFSS